MPSCQRIGFCSKGVLLPPGTARQLPDGKNRLLALGAIIFRRQSQDFTTVQHRLARLLAEAFQTPTSAGSTTARPNSSRGKQLRRVLATIEKTQIRSLAVTHRRLRLASTKFAELPAPLLAAVCQRLQNRLLFRSGCRKTMIGKSRASEPLGTVSSSGRHVSEQNSPLLEFLPLLTGDAILIMQVSPSAASSLREQPAYGPCLNAFKGHFRWVSRAVSAESRKLRSAAETTQA